MQHFKYLLMLSFLLSTSLFTEVEKVVLKWKPGFCTESCLLDLEKRLARMSDVAGFKINSSQNQATLRWKPNRRFDFGDINRTMRYVGVSLHEIFVTVRGTIDHTNRDITLKSLGDNTEFTLLGPVAIPSPGEAAAEKNLQTHKLQDRTRNQLILAEDKFRVVTIEGPLFMPERSLSLYLITEKVTIPSGI